MFTRSISRMAPRLSGARSSATPGVLHGTVNNSSNAPSAMRMMFHCSVQRQRAEKPATVADATAGDASTPPPSSTQDGAQTSAEEPLIDSSVKEELDQYVEGLSTREGKQQQQQQQQTEDGEEDGDGEDGGSADTSTAKEDRPWNKPLDARPTYKVVIVVEELGHANSTAIYKRLVERHGLDTFYSKRYVKKLLRFLKAQKLVDTEPNYVNKKAGFQYYCTYKYYERKEKMEEKRRKHLESLTSDIDELLGEM